MATIFAIDTANGWRGLDEGGHSRVEGTHGKTGGPPFLMGLFLIAGGIYVLSKQPL